MSHMDLIGMDKEKIDNYLIGEHATLLEISELYNKRVMNINLLNVAQKSLMNAAGYSKKEVKYSEKWIDVKFNGRIFPGNELYGRGRNELEAICDACQKYIDNSKDYTLEGRFYFDKLETLGKK